ncbi:MAG TPA: hypothetical protein VHE59_19230 [Mucilaginibacter sp.]|nr:hypothetical protein [Mucilaginibacter sp.]
MFSIILSATAIVISLLALWQSILSNTNSIIANLQKLLSDKAKDCNLNIDPVTKFAPSINAEVSEIFTNIIYAKRLLEFFYTNHPKLLSRYDEDNFRRFFFLQLHTSIIELVKNPLTITDYNPNTTPDIEDQQIACRNFLKILLMRIQVSPNSRNSMQFIGAK